MSTIIQAVQAAVATAKTDAAKAEADVVAAVHSATGVLATIKGSPVTFGVVAGVSAVVGGLVVHFV